MNEILYVYKKIQFDIRKLNLVLPVHDLTVFYMLIIKIEKNVGELQYNIFHLTYLSPVV